MANRNPPLELKDFRTIFDEIDTYHIREVSSVLEDVHGLRVVEQVGNYRISLERRDFPEDKRKRAPARHDYWLSAINNSGGETMRTSDYKTAVITYTALANHLKRIINPKRQ